RMCLDMLPEKGKETTHHPLMGDTRRGSHEQLPVEQVVPTAVGRERVVVAIRKDDASWHILRPRRKSITQSVVADCASDRNIQCFRPCSIRALRIVDAERLRAPCYPRVCNGADTRERQ